MKTKRNFIILLSCLAVVILGVIAYQIFSYIQDQKTQNELRAQSTEFINKWGTYSDQSSETYLLSIKPFLSEDMYAQYVQDGAEIKDANTTHNYPPNKSVIKITSGPTIKKTNKDYQVLLGINQTFNGNYNQPNSITLIWSKENNKYVITSLTSEN